MSEIGKHPWVPRILQPGDETKLHPLYENTTGKWDGLSAWKWQFQTSPAGKAYNWVADHDGRLAGQYPIVPLVMLLQGKCQRGAQALDTMTHSDYRKQGIFVTLCSKSFQTASEDGTVLVYAFPNSNSLPGAIKYLYVHLADIEASMRPLNLSEVLASKLKIPFVPRLVGRGGQAAFNVFYSFSPKKSQGISVKISSRFPEETDKLFKSASGHFANMIVRNARYLNWRYPDRPDHEYVIFLAYRGATLCGYCVVGFTERYGFKLGCIIDILTDPDDGDSFATLSDRALSFMTDKKAVAASCMITKGSPFENYLKRLGFIFLIRKFPYVVKILKTSELDLTALGNMSKWHITYGDTDFL